MNNYKEKWQAATAALPYGVQRVFHDVFTLVAEGKKSNLVYGSDYAGPTGTCLVNAADNLLVTGGGRGVPMATFGDVVSLFDTINRVLKDKGVNKDNYVSPFAAEIFLSWFAPLKEKPTEAAIEEAMVNEAFAQQLDAVTYGYVEPTDEEMARALMDMMSDDTDREGTEWTQAEVSKANETADEIMFGK
jgi:hypothetical protein